MMTRRYGTSASRAPIENPAASLTRCGGEGAARAGRSLAIAILHQLALIAAACTFAAPAAGAATPAGTQISNAASASYEASNGAAYAIHSNALQVTVQQVGSLAVTPKEATANPATDTFTLGNPYTRVFTIANTGNGDDAYLIPALTTGAGKVQSAKFVTASGSIPIVIGTTISPVVHAGASIQVSVTIDTTTIAPGTTFAIKLTAQSTVPGSGNPTDNGQVWGIAYAAAAFVNPTNPNLPVAKLVNGLPTVGTSPGGTVTFSVTFLNNGAGTAHNTLFDDVLPSGLTPDPTSVLVNGVSHVASANGQELKVPLGDVGSQQTIAVAFKAALAPNLAPGTTYVNVAGVSADNAASIQTSPSSVIAGVANVIFDGTSVQNRPLPGVSVALLDASTGKPVALTGPPMPPNTQNANPFTTGPDGAYGFGIVPPGAPGQSKAKSGASPASYVIALSAPSYRNRRIGLTIAQVGNSPLYNVTLTSLDGQPLALPGTFSLTASNVSLNNVFGVFGNLPMFEPNAIQVTKTVDRQVAAAGDRLIFTLDVHNGSGSDLGSVAVTDTLPPGMVYGLRSAQVNGVANEPSINGRVLTWNLAGFQPGQDYSIVYAAVILPSTEGATTLTNVVDATARGLTAEARADVSIVAGVFSYDSVITGRVFERTGNTGVPGAIVYLENGNAARTDAKGLFHFPSVRPGQHVVRLDLTTLPPGLTTCDPKAVRECGTVRIVHGLVDEGMLNDVQFMLDRVPAK